ncbi:hypothetical protein Godav_015103 [Gossypium davidsonii]|uniref:Uncharacterized protein n=2 Tax=Gossypium TaxID=3633 RepID=A0A7J8RLZ7_GOSDV|nr:hypothetical protein [Gossypium davidsonii]MBA0650089.1 hypothetical protein [Gossypium klotzschianum]
MEISIEEYDNLGDPSIPRISAKASNKVHLHYEDPFDKKGMTADAQEEYQVSFHDKLLNITTNSKRKRKLGKMTTSNFRREVENCIIYEIPSIKFSQRVNLLMEQIMSKIVFLKLLGRMIGFNVPDLSTTVYGKSSLSMIGDMIRKVIKIDYNMASGARGRFARMGCLY